jgi:hypothetical protein
LLPQKTEQILFADLSQLIEQSKKFIIVQANSVMTMLYWHVGKRINEDVLQNRQADCGKQIVVPLAQQLTAKYSFYGIVASETRRSADILRPRSR